MRGNELLTVAAGLLLVALLATLGVTILRIRPLLSVHMFLGLLLIPPVLVAGGMLAISYIPQFTRWLHTHRRPGAH